MKRDLYLKGFGAWPIVLALFSWLWRKRLNADNRERVVKVKGWRTALIDDKWGSRKCATFCGWFGA